MVDNIFIIYYLILIICIIHDIFIIVNTKIKHHSSSVRYSRSQNTYFYETVEEGYGLPIIHIIRTTTHYIRNN